VDLVVSVATVCAVLYVVSGGYRGFRAKVIGESASPKLIFLIYSVMVFKRVIEDSAAVVSLPSLFTSYGVEPAVILFTVPFIVGLLTGITIAYVGASFPFLATYISGEGFNPGYFMLAYVGGYMGVMLSPVHLCLVLSRQYYNASLSGVYKLISKPVITCTLAAFTSYILT